MLWARFVYVVCVRKGIIMELLLGIGLLFLWVVFAVVIFVDRTFGLRWSRGIWPWSTIRQLRAEIAEADLRFEHLSVFQDGRERVIADLRTELAQTDHLLKLRTELANTYHRMTVEKQATKPVKKRAKKK